MRTRDSSAGTRAAAVLAAVLAALIVLPIGPAVVEGGGPRDHDRPLPQAKGRPSKPPRTASPTPTPTPTPSATATSPAPTPSSTPVASTNPALPTSGYAVATWGSDTNAGTLASPWRTLQKAADSVPAGQTVWIRGGTYGGFTMTRSGTATAEITLAEYPGETAIVAGSTNWKVIALTGVHDVTISGLTVQGAPSQYGAGIYIESGSYDITIVGNTLQNNRSFGVKVLNSSRVTIRNNAITRNETGIEVSAGGDGILIADNRIYANDRMVVNDTTAWNDRGANAIVFYRSTGRITVTGNTIYGNRAVSHDYGFDGGAFEIYASSNITMTGNVLWDNENVVETGTNGTGCLNNVFTRNVAYKGGTTSIAGPAMGLILRCAGNMLVANNSFYGLDRFTFDITLAGGFAGSIDGLRILNNIAVASDHPYSIDTVIPGTLWIDRNLVWNPSGGSIAYVYGRGNTQSRSQFTSWTGFDAAGVQADPQYLAPTAGDLRLAGTSPAVDKGLILSGVTSGYLGLAPDLGRHETR